MAIFGNQNTGTVNLSVTDNICGGFYTVGSKSGVADSITVRLEAYGGPVSNQKVTCGLYKYVDYSSSYAGDLVGQTEVVAINIAFGETEWKTFNFEAPKPNLSANTNYYIVVSAEAGAYLVLEGSEDAGQDIYKEVSYSDTLLDPLEGETASSYRRCIYCTYTENPDEPKPVKINKIAGKTIKINKVNGKTIKISN